MQCIEYADHPIVRDLVRREIKVHYAFRAADLCHQYLDPLVTEKVLVEVKADEAMPIDGHQVLEVLREPQIQIHLIKDDLSVYANPPAEVLESSLLDGEGLDF